jgi:hypothetical protein
LMMSQWLLHGPGMNSRAEPTDVPLGQAISGLVGFSRLPSIRRGFQSPAALIHDSRVGVGINTGSAGNSVGVSV